MPNRNARRAARAGGCAADAAVARGFAAHQAGDLRKAAAAFQQALAAAPKHAAATRMLAEVMTDQGRFAEAMQLAQRVLAADQGDDGAWYALANAQRLGGAPAAAVASYERVLARQPGFAGALHGLGLALRALAQDEAAAARFAEAARAAPGWAPAWQELGMSLAVLGRLGPAAAALRRAVAIDPGLAAARRHLLAIQPDAAAIPELTRLLADPGTGPAARVETGFALGRLLDGAGQYDAAFAAFAAANRTLRSLQEAAGQRFDGARLRRDVDRLIAAFPAGGFAGRVGGAETELPVFIVGMPRAGTSLVEQILASHAQVFGAGELRGIGEIALRLGWAPGAAWTPAALGGAAAEYLTARAAEAGDALRVPALRIIDKMPDNIFQLGLIATLFPQARVIFCERDALDTCFSCFTQRFAEPHGFDTDLADCGLRYREVARLTRHWHAVLPLPMLRVSYEALVADPDAQARRLVDFLGLDWDPSCLAFHEAARPVRTASWAQVRKPVYASAVGRARHYAGHLGPLVAALAG
jgi:tetratricopeptide (TPR) repeat protein